MWLGTGFIPQTHKNQAPNLSTSSTVHSVIDGTRGLPPEENSVHQMRGVKNIRVSPITADAHVSLR